MKTRLGNSLNQANSALFSIPAFKSIFKSGTSSVFTERLRRYRSLNGSGPKIKAKALLGRAYAHLCENYRSEYLYKNKLVNELMSNQTSTTKSSLLNEFKIGCSIADLVIVNKTNTIYEIKTELDSPEKLKKQILDYKRVSSRIYVVTHHTLINKYDNVLCDDSIGLYYLSAQNTLEEKRPAFDDHSELSCLSMLETLRKPEYSSIIERQFGGLPQVSNIKFYSACQDILRDVDPKLFHTLVLEELRMRKVEEAELIESIATPESLRHICLAYNPSKGEMKNLHDFLELAI